MFSIDNNPHQKEDVIGVAIKRESKQNSLLNECVRTRTPMLEILRPTYEKAFRELSKHWWKMSPFFYSDEYQCKARDVDALTGHFTNIEYGDFLVYDPLCMDSHKNPLIKILAPTLAVVVYPLHAHLVHGVRTGFSKVFSFNKEHPVIKKLSYIDERVERTLHRPSNQ